MPADADIQDTALAQGSPPQGARGPARAPRRPTASGGVDVATLIGICGAFALIATAIVLGGSWTAFIDLPAFLIVIGGTMMVTLVSFRIEDLARAPHILGQCWRIGPGNAGDVARTVLSIAEQAKREGVITLQRNITALRLEPFFARGIELAADGLPSNQLEDLMRQENIALIDRHQKAVSILFRAADVAPAMGLIGTLVGLVQMLGNLDDPTTIGPSMAVALLTTFYGAILANMVFAPLATKLERRSADEALHNELYLLGCTAIGRQENPRRLELLLNTVLPPAERVAYFK